MIIQFKKKQSKFNDIIKMIAYKVLNEDDINIKLFNGFIRHQVITKSWRKQNDEWIIIDAPSVDDWSEEDYQFLVKCLKNTVSTGGFVYGAFNDIKLIGFVSVEPQTMGNDEVYRELSSIHVSEDMRRKGIGKQLFLAAKEWALKSGADKLYISGHPSVESQAFYKKMGCVEAKISETSHVSREPFDCQLECKLK